MSDSLGDPGAYETAGYRSVSSQAASSFSTKASKGAFGGQSKRELKMTTSFETETTPGAGTYSPMLLENGREHEMSDR